MKVTLLFTLTLTCCVVYTSQQSYHFSNGWNPGKRTVQSCTFSPYIKNLIFKLIGNELNRLQKCSRQNIPDTMEFYQMQDKDDDIRVPVSQVMPN